WRPWWPTRPGSWPRWPPEPAVHPRGSSPRGPLLARRARVAPVVAAVQRELDGLQRALGVVGAVGRFAPRVGVGHGVLTPDSEPGLGGWGGGWGSGIPARAGAVACESAPGGAARACARSL